MRKKLIVAGLLLAALVALGAATPKFFPSTSFRGLLVDQNNVPYSIGTAGAAGSFFPSNQARVLLVDQNNQPYKASTGGGGGVTSITTANGITGGPITSTGTILGINAAADGATKGVASFAANDFNAAAGVISLRDIGLAVYNDADETISDGAVTSITFNQERWDTDSMHSISSNTDQITFNTAGKYTVSFNASFASNDLGSRALVLELNGTTRIAQVFVLPNVGNATTLSLSTIYNFAVNDILRCQAYQSSGGNLAVLSTGNYSPECRVQRLG